MISGNLCASAGVCYLTLPDKYGMLNLDTWMYRSMAKQEGGGFMECQKRVLLRAGATLLLLFLPLGLLVGAHSRANELTDNTIGDFFHELDGGRDDGFIVWHT
jgi:hypothetical protein